MSDRCTGRCCAAFYVGETIESLRSLAETNSKGRAELLQVADMLIPVVEVHVGDSTIGMQLSAGDSFSQAGFIYTCRHFDDASGNCEIYETRPPMCSEYPYEHGRCRFDSCTWSDVNAPYERVGRRVRLALFKPESTLVRMQQAERELLEKAAQARAIVRNGGA